MKIGNYSLFFLFTTINNDNKIILEGVIMHKIKGIVFDIDDTLYSHKINKVPELTIYTIKELRKAGFKIGLCTSRFPKEFYS